MHTNEGTLRAYLDGELDARACAAVAAHLRECAACRRQLDALASRASVTSQYLQSLAPRGAELPAPAPVALARLHKRLATDGRSASLRRPEGGFVEMFRRMFNARYRTAWAGLATVLVLASLLTLPPVQAAASQFLGLFRVRKFAVVTIDPAAVSKLEQVGGQIDKLLSDSVTFVQEPTAPVSVASVDEAAQKAGISVRLPADLGAPTLMVENGVDAKLKVDLPRVRAILEAVGRSDVKLPDSLDGADVEFIVPPAVMASYGCVGYNAEPMRPASGAQPRKGLGAGAPDVERPQPSPRCVTLVQLAGPTVNAPAGVDITQIGEAMLRVLGLSAEDARHFSQAIDWSSTLVIPMPIDAGSFRDVTVDGVPGVLIESNPGLSGGHALARYVLFWQKNDMVYALSGVNDAARGLEIANSLK